MRWWRSRRQAPRRDIVDGLLKAPDTDPMDLVALDAAWEEEAVRFGPGTQGQGACGHEGLIAKLRHARRAVDPAPSLACSEERTMHTLNSIVFGWYPYLCLTVFLFGSLFRFDREQYTWRSGSSQLLRRRQLMWGSNLFHVGILVIFAGHFVGLLTPIWMFDALGISHGFKQMLAIVAGGIAG